MDYRDPLRALFPGVQGAVLSTLTATTRPLTLRQLADLAGAHPSQVSKHVDHLARLGVVGRMRVGVVDQISMTDTVAAGPFRQLARLVDTTLGRMEELASRMTPEPASITVFGSFVRREAGPESDIDIVIVRPATIPDDDTWINAVGLFTDGVSALTRHPVADIQIGADELPEALERPLWREIAMDGITLIGRPLTEFPQ